MCKSLVYYSGLVLLWMSVIACSSQKDSPAEGQYLLNDEIEGISVASYISGNSEKYCSIQTILSEGATSRMSAYKCGSPLVFKGGNQTLTMLISEPGTLPEENQCLYSMGAIITRAQRYDKVVGIIGRSASVVYEIEEADFPLAYRSRLASLLEKYKDEQKSVSFESLFQAWGRYLNSPEVMIQSNPDCFKDDESYGNLLSFCRNNSVLATLFVIDKLVCGHMPSGYLLDDIIPEDLQYLKDQAYHHFAEGMDIIPSSLGNMYRLAQGYLDQVK